MSKSTHPFVHIVVLHWRNYSSTLRALKSLEAISYPQYRILVVDNFSADGSIEQLQAEFPACRFLHNSENLGFSRGCNRGIHQAYAEGADYVLLLNNDMEVEPDFLEAAIAIAEQDSLVGLVTGKVLFGDRRNIIWQAGGKIDGVRIQGIPRAWNVEDRGQCDEVCTTNWATGAMLLIPRATIEKVGLLPEEYFFGVEEWDYSTSVRKLGLKIMYVPSFKGYHSAGSSYRAGDPVLIVYNGVRNKMIYAQKHMSAPLWWLWKSFFRCYLWLWWPRRAWSGCQNEQDYRARLKAARLAFADHQGIHNIELSDLERAREEIGPTHTWGNSWGPANSKVTE